MVGGRPHADRQAASRPATRPSGSPTSSSSRLVAAGARTKSQEAGLAAFDYTAGVNLHDAADSTKRTPSAFQGSGFIALSDPDCKREIAGHHLDRDRTEPERSFFFDEIVTPFADAHTDELKKYHQFGFSNAKDGQVFAQTTLDDPKFSKDKPKTGGPSRAERHLMWKMLHTLAHEYIHLLEASGLHPGARQQRRHARGLLRAVHQGRDGPGDRRRQGRGREAPHRGRGRRLP